MTWAARLFSHESFADGTARPVLACIVKRDYTMELARTPRPRDEPPALFAEPVFADPHTGDELLHDADELALLHSGVDVILHGCVHAPRGSREVLASLTIGPHHKRLRVFGDRSLERAAHGGLRISPPAAIGSLPLTYRYAFGGPALEGAAAASSEMARTVYPRNPIGVGYPGRRHVDRVLAGLRLPNVEDPGDCLTLERLEAIDSARWVDAPIPAGLGCLLPYTFPRAAFLYRMRPDDLPEIRRRDGVDLRSGHVRGAWPAAHARAWAASSASWGLRCLPLRGDEPMVLEHLHPHASLVASRLPGARVRVLFGAPAPWGEATNAELRKVVLTPDTGRMTLTYVAVTALAEVISPEELGEVRFDVEWS